MGIMYIIRIRILRYNNILQQNTGKIFPIARNIFHLIFLHYLDFEKIPKNLLV